MTNSGMAIRMYSLSCVPDDLAHGPLEGHDRVELIERQAEHAHDGGDGNADREQAKQQE